MQRFGCLSALGLLLSLTVPVLAVESSCLALAQQAPEQALAHATQQLQTAPTDHALRLCYATAAFTAGKFPLAADNFAWLATQTNVPDEAGRLHNKAGWAFVRANNIPAAGKAFAQAIKRAPHEPRYWQDHATILMQTEQYWDAQRELDQALRLAPQEAALWALRAQCGLRLMNKAQAKADATQALRFAPQEPLATAILQKLALEP